MALFFVKGWLVCCGKPNVPMCGLVFTMRHNGKRIGEVADKLDEKFNLAVT